MRWSVIAPHRTTVLLLVTVGLASLLDAKHSSVTPKDAITRSYYDRLHTLQTKPPNRLRQRSAYDSAAGEDSAVMSETKDGEGKAVAGQTFTEEDLRREQASTAKKAAAHTPAPKAPPKSSTLVARKRKPDAGVVRAPPSTAPSSFTAPPTRGPTTLPPSTEPSPPATKLPPLRLTKQSNGTYTLEQMGKKKSPSKSVDYFGRPVPEGKMMPTLNKKGAVKSSAPPSAKSVEGTLPNAIVGFPKQQKTSRGYDSFVDFLPATQPSGYDMGVDAAEGKEERKTTTPSTTTTTAETATTSVFSAGADLYGGGTAEVQGAEQKESGGYGEDAAVQASTKSAPAYGEDAGVDASKKEQNTAYSEDAAILSAIEEEGELTTSQPEETTESDGNDEDTPASMNVRESTTSAADETEPTTPATTLAAAGGYEDQAVEGGAESRQDESTTVAYDQGVESSSNETDVESTTSNVIETTTTIFERNPYGGEEENREVDVSVESTTMSADYGSNSTGYGSEDEEDVNLDEEDALLSSSTTYSKSTEDNETTTPKSSDATTDMLSNFAPKEDDSVAGEIDEGEETTTQDGVEEMGESLDDNAVEEGTTSLLKATTEQTTVDDEEVVHAVERVLAEELAQQSTTVKGPTVTSKPMKVLDKKPTRVHNRLSIHPQEAQRGRNATAPQKGFTETCPPPRRCPRNCFVFINDNGCQDCQCLWQSLPCEAAEDCPEASQYCDGGKCQCRPGYKQNMRKSSSCEIDESFQGVRSLAPHVKSDAAILKGREMHQVKEQSPMGYRRKRAVLTKTFRNERLQWPGIVA